MLTLEQIKNITFTKSMGGYKTSEVDDFIDQCGDTVASLIEERNASNKKLEVLADKLMEYRNEEDSIRSALVNAQRLGDTIVREANQKAALAQEDATIKAEKLVEDARAKADDVLNSVTDDVKAQQAELRRVKREVALFKERMLSIYKEHLSLIDLLPEEEPEKEQEQPPQETTPQTVEEKAEPVETADVSEQEQPQAEEETVTPAVEEPVAKPVAVAASAPVVESPRQVPLVPVEPPIDDQTEDKTADKAADKAPKSRFGDLKFGEDYVIAEDKDDKNEGKGFFKRRR